MDVTLDYSNFGSYSYFTATGAQYGSDVVSMVGPYGFAHYGFLYSGYLFWTRLGLELFIKGGLSVLIVWYVRQPGSVIWRSLWFLVILAVARLTDDIPLDLCILLSGLYLIARYDHPKRQTVQCFLSAGLAFLSLCKGTHTVLALGTLGLVGLQALLTRRFARAGWVAASYAAGYLALWLIARQNPLHIPAFLRGIRELASGYNAAMSVQEATWLTWVGGTAAFGLISAGLMAAWLNRRAPAGVLSALLLTAFSFIEWKHGYVRADGHVFIFFQFACAAAIMLLLVRTRGAQTIPPSPLITRLHQGLSVIALGFAAFGASDGGNVIYPLRTLPPALPQNIVYLLHARETKERLEETLATRRTQFALPLIRQLVGDKAGVDFFGYEHGYIPLNGLRYAHRPMSGGSFNVYTPYLMRRNEEFLTNPKTRPDYFLLKLQTVDERLVSQDDALTLRAIVSNYEPRLVENGVLLLRARGGDPVAPKPQPLSSVDFALGERLAVPSVSSSQILLMSLEFQPTILGRLRTLAYKPGHLYMDLEGNEIEHRARRRIVPAMISSPVILNPLLENTADFIELYNIEPGKQVTGLVVTADQPACYSAHVRANFYTMPRPVPPRDVDIGEIATYARSPLWNIKPERIEPADAPQRNYGGLLVQFLHAPGQLTFKLDGSEREVVFDYGFDPVAAAQKEGNGVVFIVEIEAPDKSRKELFRRHLIPMQNKADQGNHSQSISLPSIAPGSRLLIRTDPGPFGDNAWDWSYVTRIQIKRGPFHLKQFPGFSVVPVRADGDHFGAVNVEGKNLFMLNAPGLLEFELAGNEHEVEFSGGILPGAYTNGGESDGVAFIVEYRFPDSHLERLFYRHIRPRLVPEDRGDQAFHVALPFHPPGTRLRLLVDPGPAGDKSWDWSYISHFQLK